MVVVTVIGAIVVVVGWVWVLILAFQKSVLWGLGVFFFSPLVFLIFGLLNLDVAKRAMLVTIGGMLLLMFGAYAENRAERHRQRLMQIQMQAEQPSTTY